MTAKILTAIFFFYEKNYYEKLIKRLADCKSIYKKFLCSGEIGIGVILYEKGKGKFVGDWEKPTTQKF